MLLPMLVLIPFIFGLLCWQSERINFWMPRWVALCGTGIVFLIVLLLCLCQTKYYYQLMLNNFLITDLSSPWQLEYICDWIPRFGINFHLALDGLSLLMLLLAGILGLISILSSWNEIYRYQGLFYCNLLWILGGVVGFFLAIDMFLLFFFWEIILIPMYFLISIWGYEDSNNRMRIRAAITFFIYSQMSSLLMLLSIIILVSFNYALNGIWSFSYEDLLHVRLPKNVEYLLMLGFFLAFAIKLPVVPFHAWLPETHSYSPVTGSVDLIGILLKTAVYGLFRFTLPLFPNASQSFTSIAMFLGLLNIFYGSWMAFVQMDVKRLIAYANISHMGFVLIAIYGNNQISYQGAIIQMISYSLSASGMFILCAQLHKRLHTRNMTLMGGLWNRINLLPAFSLCFIAAMLGIPGSGNFIGEITVLFGNFQTAPIFTILATLGILFTSIYSIRMMQLIFYGESSLKFGSLEDMTFREKFIVLILLLCIFTIGLFPQFIINIAYESMKNIDLRLQENY